MADDLVKRAEELRLTNLTFAGFRNREGVREIMNITDATFISYLPVGILETGSPNKYFDGLAAGKLIIINFGGWIKEEIERARCGLHVSDAADFVGKIRPFLADRNLLESYRNAARTLAETKYSRRTLGERFAKIAGARQS
jgi:glycosyltransferase involved in cell wall biosynthesis